MYKLKSEIKYNEEMDKNCIPLCDAINALPSVETFESCEGHVTDSFRIWFRVKHEKEGLFFLTRCVDHRYWEHGGQWKLELVVGDSWNGKSVDLPIYYMLHSNGVVGEEAYKQVESLIENMNFHLNHDGFMKGFDLNIEKFDKKLLSL